MTLSTGATSQQRDNVQIRIDFEAYYYDLVEQGELIEINYSSFRAGWLAGNRAGQKVDKPRRK